MTTGDAPAAARPRRAAAGATPHVLFFSSDGEVADLYRAALPAGWRFSALRDRDDEEEKLRLLADADVVLHTDGVLSRHHLAAAPHLALVHRQGVGLDALDEQSLRDHGVALAICPAGTTEAVAEHAVMLALAAGRHLPRLHQQVAERGSWPKWEYRIRSTSLHGSTAGLVGFGRIGQAVAHRLLAFGCRVLVHRHAGASLAPGWRGRVEPCPDLDELFARSDLVSLHCPLRPETRGMVDARRLALMQPGSVLVNTARGGLVAEPDLAAALRTGRPGAAGLDVLSVEPPGPDNPLLGLPNVVLTPHCAAGTRQVQQVKAREVLANVARFWSGEPVRDRIL